MSWSSVLHHLPHSTIIPPELTEPRPACQTGVRPSTAEPSVCGGEGGRGGVGMRGQGSLWGRPPPHCCRGPSQGPRAWGGE